MTDKEVLISTLQRIAGDFRQPLEILLPVSLCIILLWAGVSLVWKTKRKVRYPLFFIYLVVLLEVAFFSRESGSRKSLDLELFATWGMTPVEHAYFIENIIMFVPFGILLPWCFRFFRKGYLCILFGMFCSMALEYSQYVTERGYSQLDDVVTNTLGAAVGFLFFKLIQWMLDRKQKNGAAS